MIYFSAPAQLLSDKKSLVRLQALQLHLIRESVPAYFPLLAHAEQCRLFNAPFRDDMWLPWRKHMIRQSTQVIVVTEADWEVDLTIEVDTEVAEVFGRPVAYHSIEFLTTASARVYACLK